MISMEDQRKYAQVLLSIGVALKDGQALCVEAPVGQEEFVSILAQEAYKLGCKEFGVLWRSDRLEHARLSVQSAPPSRDMFLTADYYAQQGAAYLRLDSPDLTIFNDLPVETLAQKAREDAQVREVFRKKAAGCGQTIACIPSVAWADAVFPELPQSRRLDALWNAVLQCTRCREPDPIRAWQDYLENTARRKSMLDEKGYTAFHYHGDGTDLTISPAEGRWKGSCMRSEDRVSVPNIPTEEVFLTPHKYKVDGKIISTMPLNYKGWLIEGIELEFQKGRIVRHTAKRGADLLASIIETDEGSHYIGEMALVDQASPIARLNRIFYTTLYDENASCHIAIGNALGPVRDPAEREAKGMNTSSIHVDFMVGSDTLCIDGLLPNGQWEPVFRNGHWAL